MSFTKIRQDSFSRRVSSGRKSVFETSPKQVGANCAEVSPRIGVCC